MQSNMSKHSLLLSSYLYLKVTFSCPVIENFIWIEPLLRGHLSYKATFSLFKRWPLNIGLIVHTSREGKIEPCLTSGFRWKFVSFERLLFIFYSCLHVWVVLIYATVDPYLRFNFLQGMNISHIVIIFRTEPTNSHTQANVISFLFILIIRIVWHRLQTVNISV